LSIISDDIGYQIKLSFIHFKKCFHYICNSSYRMGKLLIIVGIACIIGGILVIYLPKIPFLGKLPGDIRV
jgi:hypothetical protein